MTVPPSDGTMLRILNVSEEDLTERYGFTLHPRGLYVSVDDLEAVGLAYRSQTILRAVRAVREHARLGGYQAC